MAGDSAHAHKWRHVGVPWSQGKPSLIVVFGVAGDSARAHKCRHVGVPRSQRGGAGAQPSSQRRRPRSKNPSNQNYIEQK